VDLVTHDLGNAISNWDVALAKKMEELASEQ
jgi:pterin-4a-carbinolamine dehydratase